MLRLELLSLDLAEHHQREDLPVPLVLVHVLVHRLHLLCLL